MADANMISSGRRSGYTTDKGLVQAFTEFSIGICFRRLSTADTNQAANATGINLFYA